MVSKIYIEGTQAIRAHLTQDEIKDIEMQNSDNFGEYHDLLLNLMNYPEEIQLIKNFRNFNPITEATYEFINKFFQDDKALTTLAEAYGLLDVKEKYFVGNDHPLCPPKNAVPVIQHLEELLPTSVVACPEAK